MNLSKSPYYKWYVVGMLWWISFFNYADRQAIFSVFPLLEKEMHLDSVQLGLLGSSFAWTYGLAAPFAGLIVDRVRRKAAILTGLHVWSLICMATALSRNFYHLLFFRAAEGLGETIYYPASMSMISDYHGKATRSRAMGLHQTSVYVGTIGGGFFAGLIGQYYGWRWSFIVFGALGILLGLFLNRLLVEPARGQADLAELGPHARLATRMPPEPLFENRLGHAHRPHPHVRFHLRQLRRHRPALLDAQVPLRQIRLQPGHGRLDGHSLRSARQHARLAARRMAGRYSAPPLRGRPHDGAGRRAPARRPLRLPVRQHPLRRRSHRRPHLLGTVQGLLRRQHFRFRLRRRPP
jgi:hypothetical protein